MPMFYRSARLALLLLLSAAAILVSAQDDPINIDDVLDFDIGGGAAIIDAPAAPDDAPATNGPSVEVSLDDDIIDFGAPIDDAPAPAGRAPAGAVDLDDLDFGGPAPAGAAPAGDALDLDGGAVGLDDLDFGAPAPAGGGDIGAPVIDLDPGSGSLNLDDLGLPEPATDGGALDLGAPPDLGVPAVDDGELNIDSVIDIPGGGEPATPGGLEDMPLEGLDDLQGLGIELDEGNGAAPQPPAGVDIGGATAEGPAQTAEDIMADQVVKRKKLQLEAEELSIEGRELYLLGKYEDAASKLIAAQLKLDAVSRTDPVVVERKAKLELLLAALYEEWAEAIARDAARLAKEEEFDDAVDKYRKAMNKNPQRTREINRKIKDLNRARRFAEFRQDTAPHNVDPEKPSRDYEIDRLLAQGEVFFNHRRYSDAREKFEQILLKDPYNLDATRFLRRINETFDKLATERRTVMKAERIAEIRWKWNDPVTPLVSPDVAIDTGESVRKLPSDTDSIQDKLNNIIIPKISFEEATIETVIKYLKQRSRELDPDGEGVNIMLNITKRAAVDAGPAPDDFGDGGGDFGGGDFGDDFGAGGDDFGAGGDFGGGAGDFGGGGGGDFGGGDFGGGGDFDPLAGDNPEPGLPENGGGGGTGEALITVDFDNIPLGEVIRYICQPGNLKYKVDKHAVIIASQDFPFDDMETRFYPVHAGFLRTQETREAIQDDFGVDQGGFDEQDGGDGADPVRFFEEMGVSFPEGAKITYSAQTSKLIVTNTPDELRKIEKIITELDLTPTQVTIEAKFVEISQTDLEELGFDWMFAGSGGDLDAVENGFKDLNLSGDAKVRIDKTIGTTQSLSGGLRFNSDADRLLQVNSILGSMQFNTVIRALKQKQSTDILSAPKVTTVTGSTATIKMVDIRYFPEGWTEPELQAATQGGNGATTGASFRPSTPEFGAPTEIGVILTVTPTVGSDGYSINLELEPVVREKIGDDDYSYNINLGQGGDAGAITATVPLRQPIISEREVQTNVIVWDGETVVLGGMIRENLQQIDDRVPFLGELPLVGKLFRVHREESLKRNLLIFVSARLVNPAGLPIRTADIRGLPDFRR